jgi:3-methyladenine DNA glycosylase AlkD
VDASAAPIVGGWLATRSRAPLRKLARSTSVWERRIAIIATYFFIR